MKKSYSTREAAKKLDVALITLQKHVAKKTFPIPPLVKVGGVSIRLWITDPDIRTRSESTGENTTRTKEKSLTAQKRGHYNRPHEHLTEESSSFSHTPVAQPFCSRGHARIRCVALPPVDD